MPTINRRQRIAARLKERRRPHWPPSERDDALPPPDAPGLWRFPLRLSFYPGGRVEPKVWDDEEVELWDSE